MNKKIESKSVLENLEQQDTPTFDDENSRWIRCKLCGKVAPIKYFWVYGGVGEVNLGKCYDCMKPKVGQMIYFIRGHMIIRGLVLNRYVKDLPSHFEVMATPGIYHASSWAETKEIATARLKSYWLGDIEYID